MKIINNTLFVKGHKEYSVAEAVEYSLSQLNSDGDLERLRERLDNQQKAIGLIVEHMVEQIETKNAGKRGPAELFLENFLSTRFKII